MRRRLKPGLRVAGGFKGDGEGGTGRKAGGAALVPLPKHTQGPPRSGLKTLGAPQVSLGFGQAAQIHPPALPCPGSEEAASPSSAHLGQRCHEFSPVSSPRDEPRPRFSRRACSRGLPPRVLSLSLRALTGERCPRRPRVGKIEANAGQKKKISSPPQPRTGGNRTGTGGDLHGAF